jgi:hypothetical protein
MPRYLSLWTSRGARGIHGGGSRLILQEEDMMTGTAQVCNRWPTGCR